MESSFNLRRCVSLTLGLSFIVMTVTGLILFVVPKGKVAYWSDWMLFGLSKEQWTDLHITSMVLLMVSGIWHIYYNWSAIVNYLRDHAKRVTLFKREFLAALLLNLFFVVGTFYNVQPLKSLLDLNADIKAYWERNYGSPPFGHAEESTLKSFTGYSGLDAVQAVERLRAKGLKVSGSDQTLKEIARENGISPQELSNILKPGGGLKKGESEGITFLGRRSLQELAEMGKIDLEKSLEYLKRQGVDADPAMRMREAGDMLGVTPYEAYESLKKASAR